MVSSVTLNGKKTPSLITWMWGAGSITIWVLFSPSSLLIFALGMLPSLVAFFIDRTDHKYAVYCVSGLNFCGTLPFLLKLTADHSLSAAMEIMGDVFTIAIIFAAAGFGWMLFLSIPPVITAFLTVITEARVKSLKTIQQRIVDEWGGSVIEENDSNKGMHLDVEGSTEANEGAPAVPE